MRSDAATSMATASTSRPLPLYTQEEAFATFRRFESIPRHEEYRISPEFLIRPHQAGHIVSWRLKLSNFGGDRERQKRDGAFFRRHWPV